MKRSILLMFAVAIASFAGTGQASAAEVTPPAMRLKISAFDGGKKIKVAKKIKAYVSCSKDCNLTVRAKLTSPINTIKTSGSALVTLGKTYRTGFRLTKAGLKYLKQTYKKDRLYVSASAVDIETGKRVKANRTFRFKR